MKIQVTFKTPDAVNNAVEAYFELNNLDPTLSSDVAIRRLLGKWIRYGECVTLEVDLDNGTCTVREA